MQHPVSPRLPDIEIRDISHQKKEKPGIIVNLALMIARMNTE